MWMLTYMLFCFTLHIISGKLVGDNICRREESYIVNVTEYYVRNATVRSYKWCLNVPPRCSHYTTKKINDTRTIQKNETKLVEQCCPGFTEMEDNCVDACESCEGHCVNSVCFCSPGFSGANCNISCPPGFEGINCTVKIQGNYSKSTTMTESKETMDYIKSTKNSIEMDLEPTTTMSTISISVENESLENNTENILLGARLKEETEEFETFVATQYNNASKILDMSASVDNNNESNVNTFPASLELTTKSELKRRSGNKSKAISMATNNVEILIPVGIQYDQIAKPLWQDVTPRTKLTEEFSNIKEENAENKHLSTTEFYLINNVTVFTIITMALILLVVVVILTLKMKHKTKENNNNKKNIGVPTVAFYTASIFHTPLPDPPPLSYENPSYLTSMECHNYLNEPTVEAHVMYNTQMDKFKTECKTYEYDYPPSTGSYRAASLVEPMEIDIRHERPMSSQVEPVYDEIPCRRDDESLTRTTSNGNQPISLYMNTCRLK